MAAQTYFTGKPCKRGHLAPRFASTRNCVECNKQRALVCNLNETQIQQRRDRAKSDYWSDPEEARARGRQAGRDFYLRHPKRVLADTRAQQLKKQQRTPPWADLKAIRKFYEACPEGHEVDHIHPLNGELISGLHVLENLQYLPMAVNRAKGNKF